MSLYHILKREIRCTCPMCEDAPVRDNEARPTSHNVIQQTNSVPSSTYLYRRTGVDKSCIHIMKHLMNTMMRVSVWVHQCVSFVV